MDLNARIENGGSSRIERYLLAVSAGMTYLLITLGGVVCVTQSGAGCPDWPGCYGQVIPPAQASAIIEYFHRLVAALTSPLIVGAAFVTWRNSRPVRWVSAPPRIAIVFLVTVIILGALAVTRGIPPALAVVDLGSALIVLALMMTAAVVAFARRSNLDLPDRLVFRNWPARLALLALGGTFIVLASSVLVAEPGSTSRCLGFPLVGQPVSTGVLGTMQSARLSIAVVTAFLIIAAVFETLRASSPSSSRRAATAVGILLALEMLAGLVIVAGGFDVPARLVYAASAAALWSALVALAVSTGLAGAMETIGKGLAVSRSGALN